MGGGQHVHAGAIAPLSRPPPSPPSRRDRGLHHRPEPSPVAAAEIPEVLCSSSSSSSIFGSGEIPAVPTSSSALSP
jgi:hypothetical protein